MHLISDILRLTHVGTDIPSLHYLAKEEIYRDAAGVVHSDLSWYVEIRLIPM